MGDHFMDWIFALVNGLHGRVNVQGLPQAAFNLQFPINHPVGIDGNTRFIGVANTNQGPIVPQSI